MSARDRVADCVMTSLAVALYPVIRLYEWRAGRQTAESRIDQPEPVKFPDLPSGFRWDVDHWNDTIKVIADDGEPLIDVLIVRASELHQADFVVEHLRRPCIPARHSWELQGALVVAAQMARAWHGKRAMASANLRSRWNREEFSVGYFEDRDLAAMFEDRDLAAMAVQNARTGISTH